MSKEFQVVLLALDCQPSLMPLNDSLPDPLLPVGNKPLLAYQLSLLESFGFTELLFIVARRNDEISEYMRDLYQGPIKADVHVVEDGLGTAQALWHVRQHITKDFLVMKCDTLLDPFFTDLANLFRLKEPAVAMLLVASQDGPITAKALSKGPETLPPADFVALTADNRVAYHATSVALSMDINQIRMKKGVLKRFPDVSLRCNLVDPHVYLFSHWVLDLIGDTVHLLPQVKTALVPFLVQAQFSSRYSRPESSCSAMSMSSSAEAKRFPELRCYAHVADASLTHAHVVDVSSYIAINRNLAADAFSARPDEAVKAGRQKSYVAVDADISQKTSIGGGCIVGSETTIGDRCSVKRSVIGKNCTIGTKVKLSNCVIHDNVTLEDGVVITESVLCSNVFVTKGCHVATSVINSGDKIDEDVKDQRNSEDGKPL